MLIGKHSTSAEIHSLKVVSPSHCDVPMNRATIAISGVIPFTKLLLEHPEIRKGGAAVQENREAAADAAVAAASGGGGLNMGGLNVKLEAVRREKEDRRRHGMEIEDDGIAPGALGADAAATLAGMDAVKAKGGAIFGAAMLAGDTAGIEFSGDYIRGRAQELARQHRGKDAKAASDAALRVLAQCTEAGRDGRGGEARGGRGGRGRVPWKEVAAELQTATARQQLYTPESASWSPVRAWRLRCLRTSCRHRLS